MDQQGSGEGQAEDGCGRTHHVISPSPSVFTIGELRIHSVHRIVQGVSQMQQTPGHVVSKCGTIICKKSKQEDHQTMDCMETKHCNLCREAGHLYRDYPKQTCTSAQAMIGAVANNSPWDVDTPPTTAGTPTETETRRSKDSLTTSSSQTIDIEPSDRYPGMPSPPQLWETRNSAEASVSQILGETRISADTSCPKFRETGSSKLPNSPQLWELEGTELS